MSNSSPAVSALRAILRSAAVIYTVIVLFLCFILTGLSDSASSAVAPLNFLLVFPFSLCFAAANHLHRNPKLAGGWKFLLHFVLTAGGFFCFLYLPAFYGNGNSTSIVVFAIFTVCYLLVYGVILLFRKRWNKEFRAEADYTPQFASKDAPEQRKKH